MSEGFPPRASDYAYRIERESNHHDMTTLINRLAIEGWEPVHYAIWSQGASTGVHFVMLRRPR